MPLLDTEQTIRPCPIALFRSDEVPHPERAIARGDIVRLRTGVYAPRDMWLALAPWDRYLVRTHAAVLQHPTLILCHESAAALHGASVFGDPVTVHAIGSSTGASRLAAGIRTHTTKDDRRLVEVGGIALTTLDEVAVDMTRGRHPAIGLASADAALRLMPDLTADLLQLLNESRASRRGRNIARWSLARANPLSETAFESVSRAVIEWLGFPEPRLQVAFVADSGETDRPDFFWDDFSLAGEADGDLKYDGRFGEPREILRRQGDRDTRLRRQIRDISHWGWRETTTVEPLRRILLGAGLRPIGPENAAALHTLRRALAARAPHRSSEMPPA